MKKPSAPYDCRPQQRRTDLLFRGNHSTEKFDGTGKFGATAFSPYNFNLDSGSLVFVVDAAGFAVPVSGTSLTEPDNSTKFFICETGYIGGGAFCRIRV
jgi:hypothetical protein